MSRIQAVRFDNGMVWGAGSNAHTWADVIIPADDIANLSDEQVVEMVRGMVLYAAEAYATEVIEDWENYYRGSPLDFFIRSLAHLEPYEDASTQVAIACHKIREQIQKKTRKSAKSQPAKKRGGYVYLAHCETGQYKIGKSVEPEQRIKVFDTKMPVKVELVHVFETDDMGAAEKILHSRFVDRLHSGEWFNLTPNDVADIRQIIGYAAGQFIFREK